MLLEKELKKLESKLSVLADAVEENFRQAIRAMLDHDVPLADRVIAKDAEIDQLEIEVEEECLKVLALYQPVAMDLRFIIAILKINNDLERIGDLSESVAKRAKTIMVSKDTFENTDYNMMLEKAFDMFKQSLTAFSSKDVAISRKVIGMDFEVNEYRGRLFSELRESIDQQNLSGDLTLALFSFVNCAERIADLSVNIAEDTIYLVEGKIVRHKDVGVLG
ncbi:MAG: phosphate signaling complex protein PhoU [bacterium]